MNNPTSLLQPTLAIQCCEVSKTFQDAKQKLHILKTINLQVARGEQIAIIGRSGSGKTTLLQILSGLDLPTRGQVYINGQALKNLSNTQLC